MTTWSDRARAAAVARLRRPAGTMGMRVRAGTVRASPGLVVSPAPSRPRGPSSPWWACERPLVQRPSGPLQQRQRIAPVRAVQILEVEPASVVQAEDLLPAHLGAL